MDLKIDSEDLEDMLLKIEDSFDIRFEPNELAHVKTYGEFHDAIKDKISLDHSEDCTTQQAFYKLREALIKSTDINRKEITPTTTLTEIFPKKSRKNQIKILEMNLGFKLSILRPPYFVTGFLAILLLASFVMLFIHWQYGLGLAIGGLWISDKLGNELDCKTVRDLSNKMAREHYLKSRRNSKTMNKNEFDKILEDCFIDFLGVRKSELTREARLF
ncbi:MAG: acyl carrier protein [Bacteroidota bacterium]